MNWKSLLQPIHKSNLTPDALDALERAGLSRRDFFKGAGALIVGFRIAGDTKLDAQTAPVISLTQVDSWVAISQDETVTAYSGKCDFGQGFRTVQHQLVAEELGVPIERVRMIICDTSITPDQGVSSGSQGSPTQFGTGALRQALATARESLLQMAADQFKVPMDQLSLSDGVISLKADAARKMSYGQLIGCRKLNLALNARAVTKDPARYTVLGTSVPRYDIPEKVMGTFQYVQQVRVPGMLHGKVVRPPAVGAKLVSVNQASVSSLPGNVKVVVKNDFVGVVADSEWQALQAASALDVTWSEGVGLPEQADIYNYMRKQPSRDSYTVRSEDVDQNLKAAARVVSATYLHPFQMHGSLGTSCAVADVRGTAANTAATIWSATQGIYPLRDSVALVLGIPKENVRAIFVEGSGCYGLNGADTVSYDAALLSQAVGKPVPVQLTRKDEMTGGESYGPAAVMDLRAGVDTQGRIVAWDAEFFTFTKGNRPNATTPGNIVTGALAGFPVPALVPAAAAAPTTFNNNGNSAPAYGSGCVAGRCGGTGNVASERVLIHSLASPFFAGPLRSPNRLQYTFANESFMDEIAAAVKADPVEFRLRHLVDPRLIEVLKAAAGAAGWDTRPSPKPGNSKTGVVAGRGVSCVLYEGNNGYSGMVAEVEVDQETGVITVKRLVVSGDRDPFPTPMACATRPKAALYRG
ncbi:MAG TPA: molybdopterin cofactor-binding domain-containing protein [Bryobacteraceae bacterium]|nr:molybdopterin cofactor-binding domain-containing protein [Bryobacteraceae bacterium]